MDKNQILLLCTQLGLDPVMIDGVSASLVLAACVEVESNFNQYAIHFNIGGTGEVLSIDYGIAQINDYFHIGAGKAFPSPEYVLSNPGAVIRWMIEAFKAGEQTLWSSFTNGAYKKYIPS